MVILRVILVYLFLLRKFKRSVPRKKEESDLANDYARTAKRQTEKITHRASSSTFSSFRHCSADKSIALALGTSNLRARKNLQYTTKSSHTASGEKKLEKKGGRKGLKSTFSEPVVIEVRGGSAHRRSKASSIRSGTNTPSSSCSSFLILSRACCWGTVKFPRRPGGGL